MKSWWDSHKRLCFLVVLIMLYSVSYGQWKTRTSSNKFDGSYKAATIIGTGGELPYKSPMLVINKFIDNAPSIYLTDIGYTGCDNNVIQFSFNGNSEIYTSSNTSIDSNKNAVFINRFSEIAMFSIIDLLKEKSTLYVRYTNSCKQFDYQFKLAGSSKAINYAVGSFFDEQKLRVSEERLRFETEQIDKSQKEETIRENLKSNFECGVEKKPIISSYVVFNNSAIFFDSQNEPQLVNLIHKDSLTIFNQIVKNRLLIVVKDAEGKETEYYSTKPLLQKLVDNISEFYAIEYLYNNWDEVINRCVSSKN